MPETLVYEGCPACKSGYGQIEISPEYIWSTVQGGAIGAVGAMAVDFLLPKILPTLSPTLRHLLTAAAAIGTAMVVRRRDPMIATGIGIGGTSIALYRLISSLIGGVAPTAGLSGGVGEVEVEESSYGVMIPEELGEEEIILA
jgi:hypothetical protein